MKSQSSLMENIELFVYKLVFVELFGTIPLLCYLRIAFSKDKKEYMVHTLTVKIRQCAVLSVNYFIYSDISIDVFHPSSYGHLQKCLRL